ncbi:hypothetical protein Gotur_026985, partial [Gossypium turneri]
HVATIGRGCKLEPKLISALIERWKLETYIFHILCGECTIIFEDVQSQLGLPVDGSTVAGSVQSLRDTFPESRNNSTEVERIQYARAYILEIIIQYARAYILEIIRGYLMPDLSRNLLHLRWLLKLVDFRAAGEFSWGSAVLKILYWEMCGATPLNKAKIGASYVGIPTALEDIRLLLDQRLKVQFQWIPYEDSAIRAIIPDNFFQNLNICHVKVPLVNYSTVDEHQTDRGLQ